MLTSAAALTDPALGQQKSLDCTAKKT